MSSGACIRRLFVGDPDCGACVAIAGKFSKKSLLLTPNLYDDGSFRFTLSLRRFLSSFLQAGD